MFGIPDDSEKTSRLKYKAYIETIFALIKSF